MWSCNSEHVKPLEEFCSIHGKDLQIDCLISQLGMLPDLLQTVNDQQHYGIKRVAFIGTIVDITNVNNFSKTFCKQSWLFNQNVSYCSNDQCYCRTFSTLRQLKNYLRSTVRQRWLNHVVVLHTSKECIDELDLLATASEFCQPTIAEGHILDMLRFVDFHFWICIMILQVHMHIEGISFKSSDMVTLRSTFSGEHAPRTT